MPFFRFTLLPHQIKVRDGFQTNFSSFIVKPMLCKDLNKVILYELATPKPSSRWQAILVVFIFQCFTRHLITFVNINDADVSSNGRTVNTK